MTTLKSIEESFVGSIIRYPDSLVDVMPVVLPQDLRDKALSRAYHAAITLYTEGHTVDLIAVIKRLGIDNCNAGYLSSLEDCASKASVRHYAGEIARDVQKIRIKNSLERAITTLDANGGDSALAEVSELLTREMKIDKKDPAIKSVMSRFDKTQAQYRKQGSMGIATGLDCFERIHAEYVPGHVWVMGAFTSIGKTAMSIQHRESAAPHRGMIVSTEMTEEQVVSRIIANRTGIPTHSILSGFLDHQQKEIVDEEKAKLKGESLKIYDDLYQINDIEAAILKGSMQGGIDIVWIDYVQNILSGEKDSYEGMKKTAIRLQALAKKARCCLVLLSQLSNEAASENGKGVLRFKGAGELAAIADVGIILQRDKNEKDIVVQSVQKHRHGKLGTQVFRFVRGFTSLVEIDDEMNA